MKNLFSLFICILFFAGCSDGDADEPVIEIKTIYLNDNSDKNYAVFTLPVLHVGDELSISMKLNGNGKDLKSFFVVLDENQAATLLNMAYAEDEVSSDPNFTDPKSGKLGFTDNVETTDIVVKVKITSINEEENSLSFYLNTEKKATKQNLDYEVGEEVE